MNVLMGLKKVFLLTGSYCTLRLPWMKIYRGDSDVVKMHRLAIEYLWGENPSPARRIKLLVNGLLWPILCLGPILIQLRRFGPICAEQYGISRFRQFCRMWRGALVYGLKPSDYYNFRHFIKDDLSEALYYFQSHEHIPLLEAMNKDFDTDLTRDKLRFFRFCESHGLPTIPILAVLGPGGEIEHLIDSIREQERFHQDLFFKPIDLYRGFGAESFVFDKAESNWKNGESRFSFEEICAFMNARFKGHTYLIQPHIRNAKEWRPLTTGALATCRVVTYRTLDSKIGCLAACLGVPYIASSITDHFALAAGVDIETGILNHLYHVIYDETKASDLISLLPFDIHPTTGYEAYGKPLSGWESVRDLCIRAHSEMPGLPFVGWDATLTDDGPMIVEANSIWGTTSSQIAQAIPLGRTPYPACYLQHHEFRKRRKGMEVGGGGGSEGAIVESEGTSGV